MFLLKLKKKLGDSLLDIGKGSGAPPKFVQLLQVWLKQAFGKRFKNQGNILSHAIQDDRYSCAIITANTIAHAVLDQPLWRPTAALTERLTWFMRIASAQVIPAISGMPSSTNLNPLEFDDNSLKPQNRSALTITDLLNPIQPTSPILSRDYDSDSESSQSDGNTMLTYDHTARTTADSKASTPLENESAMQVDVDDKVLTNPTSQKRPRYPDSCDSDSNSSNDSSDIPDASDTRPLKYVKPGDGTSKSAVASRSLRKSVKNGTFNINEEKFQNWRRKILEDDCDAEFDKHDLWRVRHSVCGEWKRVKEPYDATRWNKHLRDCKDMKKKKVLKTPSLFSMGFVKLAKQADTMVIDPEPQNLPYVPCPGITEADEARVIRYLKRTGALGGGGRSLAAISKEMFKKLFSKLKIAKNRKTVVDIQMHEWKWRNDHENLRVYSTSCQKNVADRSTNAKRPKPCSSCLAVLRSRPFKNAIRIPIPSDENYKFVNFRFRNKTLGKIFGRTIGVKHIIEDDV